MNSSFSQVSMPMGAWLRQRMVLYATAGVAAGFVFPALACIIKLSQLHLPIILGNMLSVQGTEPVIWITDTAPFFLGLLAGIAGRREDLVLQANAMLREREAELGTIRQGLEVSVAERTRQLDERNTEMRSVIAFARQIADIQDLPSLLSTAVQTIAERFAGLDVDLFILDDGGQSAVLRASSSAAGQALLKNGYHVAVSDLSVVGRVARRGKLLISPMRAESLDGVGRSPTKARPSVQIALPLVARSKVIGVLEVQSHGPQAAGQSEAEILQLLADQLAASIENSRLVTESRASVSQLESLTAQGTRTAWQQYLQGNSFAYQFTPAGVKSLPAASLDGQSVGHRLPILLRGQEIGSISVKRSTGDRWSPTEQDLMEKLAAQIALALENARLIEETRQRAAQEQLVSQISARFSRSLDVEALLQAAVREFAALPDVAEATVVLRPTAGQQ